MVVLRDKAFGSCIFNVDDQFQRVIWFDYIITYYLPDDTFNGSIGICVLILVKYSVCDAPSRQNIISSAFSAGDGSNDGAHDESSFVCSLDSPRLSGVHWFTDCGSVLAVGDTLVFNGASGPLDDRRRETIGD